MTITDTDATAIRLLADEREIRALQTSYFRGVDRCDEGLVRAASHEDSYDEHGPWKGPGREFAAWAIPLVRAAYEATMHFIGNVSIDISGDEAAGEIYCIATHTRVDDAGGRWLDQFGCRYIDRYARRDGRWGISRRVVVHDWNVSIPVEHDLGEAVAAFPPGCRDRSDPAYASLST